LVSISRLMMEITSKEHYELASKIKDVMVTYRDARDLINIGAYVKGSNPKIDYACTMIEKINVFLQQDIQDRANFDDTLQQLKALFN
jgi:flagellum-specific ATP synthase